MPADTPIAGLTLAARALGHPARLRILAMLRHNKLSVCQIASMLTVAPSTASGYLTELRRANLVTEHREGKWVYYRLSDEDPNAALLRFVLVRLASDPQVGEDAIVARRLTGTSPAAVCARASEEVLSASATASCRPR